VQRGSATRSRRSASSITAWPRSCRPSADQALARFQELLTRWLDIEPGTPVLVVTGLNADHHGDPVMVLEHRTRADRAEYTIQLIPTISTGR
jgi:hypothetical protein